VFGIQAAIKIAAGTQRDGIRAGRAAVGADIAKCGTRIRNDNSRLHAAYRTYDLAGGLAGIAHVDPISIIVQRDGAWRRLDQRFRDGVVIDDEKLWQAAGGSDSGTHCDQQYQPYAQQPGHRTTHETFCTRQQDHSRTPDKNQTVIISKRKRWEQ
jgi:hypothetical protein